MERLLKLKYEPNFIKKTRNEAVEILVEKLTNEHKGDTVYKIELIQDELLRIIPMKVKVKDVCTSYDKFLLSEKFKEYLENTIDFNREYSFRYFLSSCIE